MDKKKRRLPIPMMIIVYCIIVAEVYIFASNKNSDVGGSFTMETGAWIAILVAILGVASGLWAQVVQFKRDARQIGNVDDHVGRVNDSVGNVKEHTSEMKPIVHNVDENVKKIRDQVIEKIVPNLKKLDGVDTLVHAYNVEQAIKERQSPNLSEKSVLKGTIDLIYDENSKLYKLNLDLQRQNQLLQAENQSMKQTVEQYKLVVEQQKKRSKGLDNPGLGRGR